MQSVDEAVEYWNTYTLLVGVKTDTSPLENFLVVSTKAKHIHTP